MKGLKTSHCKDHPHLEPRNHRNTQDGEDAELSCSSPEMPIAVRMLVWALVVVKLFKQLPTKLQIDVVHAMGGTIPIFSTATAQYDLQQHEANFRKCRTARASATRVFEYNVTQEDASTQDWHFLDMTEPTINIVLQGAIVVAQGEPSQNSDIQVPIALRTTNKTELQDFSFNNTKTSLEMNYHHAYPDNHCACTEFQVLILLRPSPIRTLHTFSIYSTELDIEVQSSLAWHINNLITHTSHGDTLYPGSHSPLPLITSNMSTSSVSGNISGHFPASGNVHVRNECGVTGIFLVAGAFEAESVVVGSTSGDIHVKLDPARRPHGTLTHITTIHTSSGRLWAQVPHGSVTDIYSDTGDVSAFIIPYGADSLEDRSEIYTSSRMGRMFVLVYNTDEKLLGNGRVDPLLNTTSRHEVGSGKLQLQYPKGWYGRMEAWNGKREMKAGGSKLEGMDRDEGYVSVKRGKVGESYMEVVIGDGELDVSLGLY